MVAPLPIAPRPSSGEAISSWVGRIAARYDITADQLASHVLKRRPVGIHCVETLDHRADVELEAALATAARMAPDQIGALRVACSDGSAACWHRLTPAWCPECVRVDLVETGEVHQRAIWRLGCCVICPDHDTPLEDRCNRCMAAARCRFKAVAGRLRLVCNGCDRLVEPGPQATSPADRTGRGAFGIYLTPSLTRLLGQLQSDLQAMLAGEQMERSWGVMRSASTLNTVVSDLTACMVMATRTHYETGIALSDPKPGSAFYMIGVPITPAALSHYAAYGALAIIAATLDSLENPGAAGHHWAPDGIGESLNACSFRAWLPADKQTQLSTRAMGWEGPVACAFSAAVAG